MSVGCCCRCCCYCRCRLYCQCRCCFCPSGCSLVAGLAFCSMRATNLDIEFPNLFPAPFSCLIISLRLSSTPSSSFCLLPCPLGADSRSHFQSYFFQSLPLSLHLFFTWDLVVDQGCVPIPEPFSGFPLSSAASCCTVFRNHGSTSMYAVSMASTTSRYIVAIFLINLRHLTFHIQSTCFSNWDRPPCT